MKTARGRDLLLLGLLLLGAVCGAPSSQAAPARAGSGPDTVEEVRGASRQGRAAGARAQGQREFPRVEVYLTDWCPYCRKLEAFLKQNRVPYVRKNIEASDQFSREYERLGGGGIPLTRIGGRQIVSGLQLDVIASELGLKKP